MKHNLTLLFFLCLLLCGVLNSCQKELTSEDVTLPPVVNPVLSDSNYLAKMYFIYGDAGSIDTAATTTYRFDNLKRVTQKLDSSIENNFDILLPYLLTEYYYQGNDSLPYKSVSIAYPDTNPEYDTITKFYTYNSAGRLERDSFYGISYQPGYTYIHKHIGSYQYSGNIITGRFDITIIDNNVPGQRVETDTAQTDANGNVTQNVRHWGIGGNDMIRSTLSWDNQPSPFKRLSNFNTLATFPFGETFFYEIQSSNNRLHITETNSGSSSYVYDEDLTNRYTYGANGFPAEILLPDASAPGAYEKTTFIYTSL